MIPGVIARTLATIALLSGLLSAADGAGQEDAGQLPELSIVLVPGGVGADGNPSWLDVRMTFPADGIEPGAPFLRTPVKFAGVDAVAWSDEDVRVTDANGAVPIEQVQDDPDAGGFLYWRRWTAERPVQGRVALSYRAPLVVMTPKLGAGPPFDVRPQGGGLSGSFNTFLVMPDTDRPFTIDIRWELAALAPGSIGVSSFGEGHTRAPGPVDRLIATFIMAGPLGQFPRGEEASDFYGYWIDEPGFDAYELLEWSQGAYRVVADFFRESDPPTYRVFMRGNPYPGGGGSALMNSYLLSYPDTQADATELRETITHETVHNWISNISGPPGTTSWFSEGMTVYFTRELLLQSGLFTAEEFLDSVNDTATAYYTNPLNDLPNDEIAAGFWQDARIRRLPYVRGSLYFADVDAKIRDRSEGERSLDDLALAIVEMRRRGEEISTDTWRRAVTDELGSDGAEGFRDMLSGELIVPPSDAFGPCFERRSVPLRPFELGFDESSLVEPPQPVTGLVPGSAAARAGLQEGDLILERVPLYDVQNEPDRTLTLEIRRAGEPVEIEYLPRGEPVDGYQWFRRDDVPGSARECAL